MSNGDGKGSFSTEIAADVIAAAVKSVERHLSQSTAEPEAEVEAEAQGQVDLEDGGAEAGAGTGTETETETETELLRAQLELSLAKGRELMEKLRVEHDRAMRHAADLDNYKKRAQKEKDELQRFGLERVLKDVVLPVLDNLERVLSNGAATSQTLLEGVKLTHKQLEDALGRHGLRPIESLGQPFDPRYHEAFQQQERADIPNNQVVTEVVRGFLLNERLLRPALVVVSKTPS